jgi:pyruvate dehydrogenase E1 component beta subunit
MAKALTLGLRRAMADDPAVLVMGEDVGRLGGVFRVTDGLQAEFGEARVVDTPLGESGVVGTAVGLALRGYRPICEIQFDGFVFPAFDQIVNQVAKYRLRTGGRIGVPVVVRIPYGGGIGAVEHHSESPESYFVHTAGLTVVTPSSPQDAYWMIRQAAASPDPVIFLEPKRRYWEKGEVDESLPAPPLTSARLIPDVAGPGDDAAPAVATVVCYGPTVRTCVDAAAVARGEGWPLDVIDLRSLSPLDLDPVLASVRRTGRCVVVHEAPRTLGLGAEVAARVTQDCFLSLEAPVLRVTGYDTPYPPSRVEDAYLPDLDRVLDAVDRVVAW